MGYDKPYEVVGVRKDNVNSDLAGSGKNLSYKGKNIRVTAVGSVEKTGLSTQQQKVMDASTALKGTRQAYFEEKNGFHETPVYDRNLLGQGVHIEGPAVIEERITTVIVHPGWDLSIDGFGNIFVEVKK